jgi:hypothetical protein
MATITVTEPGKPAGLDAYRHATEAWEVWKLLIEKRRLTASHGKEFNLEERDGRRGYRWDGGSMKHAIQLRHGNRAEAAYFRNSVSTWLTSTGNAINVGGQGVAAVWWFPEDWADRRPEQQRPTRLTTQPPAVRRPPTARQVLDAKETPGVHPCHYCSREPYSDPHNRYKHERVHHPAEFLKNADYLCPLEVPDDGFCDYPALDLNGFSKHLRFTHSLTRPADRQRVAIAARERARQARAEAEAAATAPAEAPAHAAEPPAEPPVAAATTPAPAPAPAAAPEPAQPAAAAAAAPVERTHVHHVPGRRITPADAARAHRDLGEFIEELLAHEDVIGKLRAELTEEREKRTAAETQLTRFREVAGTFLDLATT